MLHNAQIVGFAEGTHVLMADGKWKTIENVKQGDMVMSFNPDIADSELEPRKVVDTWSGIHRECIEVHQKNKVTVVAKDQLFFALEQFGHKVLTLMKLLITTVTQHQYSHAMYAAASGRFMILLLMEHTHLLPTICVYTTRRRKHLSQL